MEDWLSAFGGPSARQAVLRMGKVARRIEPFDWVRMKPSFPTLVLIVPWGIKILDTVILASELSHGITIDDESDGGKPIRQSAVGGDDGSAGNKSCDGAACSRIENMGIALTVSEEHALRVAARC